MNFFYQNIIVLILLFGAICINSTEVSCQSIDSLETDTSKFDFIRIDHADRTIILNNDGELIRHIAGNIQLRQDTTYMYADSAVIFNSDEVHVFDSITIQQGDSISVFSDTLVYFSFTKMATLTGDVVLTHGNQQLWTNQLDYNLATKLAIYNKGATLYDDSLQLSSIKGIYNVGLEEAKFMDSVFVVHPNFTVAADSLKYLIQEKRAIFIGPTRIFQNGKDIYCESGFYDIDDDIATFSKNAQYKDAEKQATADSILYFSDSSIVEMHGNVDFQEGARKILSEFLRYNEITGETEIRGDAYYEDEKRIVHAENIFYNAKTDELRTSGKSSVIEGDQNLNAENIAFDNESQEGLATGDVVWADSVNQIIIESDSLQYRKDIDYVTAFGNKRPLMKTVMDGDTLYLTAEEFILTTQIDTVYLDTLDEAFMNDSLELPDPIDSNFVETTVRPMRFDTNRIFNAFHDVKIFKSNLQGICDSLNFNTRDSIFTFYKNPILWSDTSQFSADTIYVTMQNQQLDELRLRKNGFIINETGHTFFNQIKGKLITAYFDSQEVRRILVDGNAEAIYYATDESNRYIGVNQSICSEMEFLLSNQAIQTLKFLKDPKSKMIPMTNADHSALRLEGFKWNISDRPQSVKDLMRSSQQVAEVPSSNPEGILQDKLKEKKEKGK